MLTVPSCCQEDPFHFATKVSPAATICPFQTVSALIWPLSPLPSTCHDPSHVAMWLAGRLSACVNAPPTTRTGESGPGPSGSHTVSEVPVPLRPWYWFMDDHAGGGHCAGSSAAAPSAVAKAMTSETRRKTLRSLPRGPSDPPS